MSVLPLAAALVIASSILLNHGGNLARAWDDKDFFSHCPPLRCSEHGPEIRFPYSLESSNTSSLCRASCMNLTCSGQDTIVYHPSLGPWKVTAIDYRRAILTIISLADTSSLFPCPVPKFIASTNHEPYGNYPGSCAIYNTIDTILVQCSTEFIPTSNVRGSVADGIAGPFSCISNATRFSYLLAPYVPMSLLPLGCEVVSDHPISMPAAETCDPFTGNCYDNSTFKEKVGRILSFTETMVDLQLLNNCWLCERRGRRCAFSSQRNQTFCMPHGSHVKVIAVSYIPTTKTTSSAAAFVVILLMVTIALYLSLKKRYNKEVHLKVEMFLQTYGTSKPTRYNFSEVKKIARRFKDKVGQGGFGSVYRGELPNGVPVAVKMLESSKGEGEEFINEVATIGRIHHANIVRLLGFCSEGTRRALIYEFMPNDSLEKYIFPCDSNTSQELQVPNKMLGVALGIARGMEYLHQGCNQRILHFDIKPNNILLDYNFSPKISDFGLAKLCARDQSVVTLTAARGTMGYIAPELYSRNFGEISYKSDVYSFGMLVLEMVSGRRNSDPSVESQNEVYFPEWIYEQVTTGQDLELGRSMTQEEKETMRQLAIVALWCIQWNPKNRPSMTKVVNMLTGRLQDLQVPPKPFFSADSHLPL